MLLAGFMVNKPLFAPDATTIAAQGAIGTNHSMAWNHDCEAVTTIGATNGSHRFRAPDADRKITVVPGGINWSCFQTLRSNSVPATASGTVNLELDVLKYLSSSITI